MTYYMKITEDMYNNPEKYYKYLMKKAEGCRAKYPTFHRIVREYYDSHYGKEKTGVFVYDGNNTSVCYGSLDQEGREYKYIEYITKNLIGGKIL